MVIGYAMADNKVRRVTRGGDRNGRAVTWAARLALAIASELARRFVDVQAEINQLEAGANGPAHKPAELARLRTRLLAEWAF